MKGQARISPIYRMGPDDRLADPVESFNRIDRLRRAAWRDCGVIAVSPRELPEPLRTQMQIWAEDTYGER